MTATPDRPSETKLYRVTIEMRTKSHPNRWMPSIMGDVLQHNEELMSIDVEEINYG